MESLCAIAKCTAVPWHRALIHTACLTDVAMATTVCGTSAVKQSLLFLCFCCLCHRTNCTTVTESIYSRVRYERRRREKRRKVRQGYCAGLLRCNHNVHRLALTVRKRQQAAFRSVLCRLMQDSIVSVQVDSSHQVEALPLSPDTSTQLVRPFCSPL